MKTSLQQSFAYLSLAGLVFGCTGDNTTESQKQTRSGPQVEASPNIIFIMTDDLGYRDLGCYGQEDIKTPHIDSLANEGIKFTNCYAGSPVSAPSRSVLMTGQHTGHTTVRDNFAKIGGYPVWDYGPVQLRVPLKASDTTLAEMLKEAGYATGAAGKWGIGEPGSTGAPNKQGFDEWLGFLNQRRAHTYYPPYIWENDQKRVFEENKQGKAHTYVHDLFTDFATSFIQEHQDTSFFLYLPYAIPHSAYELPSTQPYKNREGWSDKEKAYAAMITRMDSSIGVIKDLLERYNIDSNTIIFFTSDNGAAQFGQEHFNSCGALRGYKRALYEGGIRVPMIVRMPGTIPADKESDLVWYFPDVMPTLADLAGVQPPRQIDGQSVLPALKGEDQDRSGRFLYWEYPQAYGFKQAVRWKNWKAIKLPKDSLELYNLNKDLSETDNVAAEHPEVVKQLKTYMDSAHTSSRYWPKEKVECKVNN